MRFRDMKLFQRIIQELLQEKEKYLNGTKTYYHMHHAS